MHCPKCSHKITESEIAKYLGAKGGKVSKRGDAKNLKPESELTPEQLKQRRYYLKRKEKKES